MDSDFYSHLMVQVQYPHFCLAYNLTKMHQAKHMYDLSDRNSTNNVMFYYNI